jgi:protein SCO1
MTFRFGIVIGVLFWIQGLFAYDPSRTANINKLPPELEGLEIQNRTGATLPLDLKFTNSEGEEVELKSLFQTGKPVLFSLVYFRCPTLCNFHLNGVSKALKEMQLKLGPDYTYLVISIEPSETPALAKEKQTAYLEDYKKSKPTDGGWNFLVGSKENIQTLAEAVGFPYRWNPGNEQWIHPAVLYVLSPDSTINSYLHGIEFGERDIRLALTEAGEGKIGTFLDRAALFCFQFDPNRGKYTMYAYNIMRLGGGLTVLILGTYIIGFWIRFRKQPSNSLPL